MTFNPKLPLYAGAIVADGHVALRLVESDGRILSDVSQALPAHARGIGGLLESVKATLIAGLRAAELGESLADKSWVGMGLPPDQVAPAVERLSADGLGLAGSAVAADLHVRCLGAHQGPDGGIIEADVHCRGLALPRNIPKRLGGGWPLADHGGLAAIGRAALSDTLDALDGLAPSSDLSDAISEDFDDRDALLACLARGDAADAAAIGRRVLAMDGTSGAATRLIDEAAARIDRMADRLTALGAQSIVITGALAKVVSRRCGEERFAMARGDACDGALTLVRRMTNPLSPH